MDSRSNTVFRNKLIGWCLFALLVPSLSMAGMDTITWRVTDWPPVYILNGPYKGKGAGDEIIKFFSERMPGYRHETQVMNSARFYTEAERGSKVCNVTGLPRDTVQTSVANGVILPHQVIIRKDKAQLLPAGDSVSLDSLLNDSRLTAGITFDRYGQLLDPIVNRYKGREWIYNVVNYNSVIEMLFMGRFDYTLEYPQVIRYHERLDNREDIVTAVPIKEVIDRVKYYTVYVVCPKNEWGNRVIDKLNDILLTERNTEQYREYILQWVDEGMRDEVNGYMDIAFSEKPRSATKD